MKIILLPKIMEDPIDYGGFIFFFFFSGSVSDQVTVPVRRGRSTYTVATARLCDYAVCLVS